jgi:hypothetical protein
MTSTAWIWIGVLTFTTYALAGHMREQVCLYMCPWPRIQAALTDPDALNVAYRADRGEPRMSLKESTRIRAKGERAGPGFAMCLLRDSGVAWPCTNQETPCERPLSWAGGDPPLRECCPAVWGGIPGERVHV